MNELNEIEIVKMSNINIIVMKKIQAVSKDRLGKETERMRIEHGRFSGCENAAQVVARANWAFDRFKEKLTDPFEATPFDELKKEMDGYNNLHNIDKKEVEILFIGTPIEKYFRMRNCAFYGCATADEIADRAEEIANKMRCSNGTVSLMGLDALLESFREYAEYFCIDDDALIHSVANKWFMKVLYDNMKK